MHLCPQQSAWSGASRSGSEAEAPNLDLRAAASVMISVSQDGMQHPVLRDSHKLMLNEDKAFWTYLLGNTPLGTSRLSQLASSSPSRERLWPERLISIFFVGEFLVSPSCPSICSCSKLGGMLATVRSWDVCPKCFCVSSSSSTQQQLHNTQPLRC
jgi:hypothetical protein